MEPLIFARGTAGLPTSTLVADLSERTPETSFTWSALWGPLDATIRWVGGMEEGFRAADQWLGNPIEIWSPDGEWCWEGIIWSVTFGSGGRRRNRSLEGYANLARVHWRAVDYSVTPSRDYGQGQPQEVGDPDGQSQYGVIEYQHNAGELSAVTAAAVAARVLTERSRLLYVPESGSLGSAYDTPTIELYCYGWYRTLGYKAYVSTTAGTADIATVMQAILTAAAPHISTDYSGIQSIGIITGQQFDTYETGLEIIKRLVGEAQGYTFGLDRGRVPYLRQTNRLQATAEYVELATGEVQSSGGGAVQLWNVRPDSVLRQADVAASGSLGTVATDTVESIYLSETTYNSSDNSLSYRAAVAGILGEVFST